MSRLKHSSNSKNRPYVHVFIHGREKTVVGWSELVDFPEWGVERLRAKVDTGARTSALHVEDLTELPNGHVRFCVVAHRGREDRRYTVTAPVTRWARVRSSTGHFTKRCFVKARISLGHVEKVIEISLVSREKMQYRMLLGRTALAKDFVVDVSSRRILTEAKNRKPAHLTGKKSKGTS